MSPSGSGTKRESALVDMPRKMDHLRNVSYVNGLMLVNLCELLNQYMLFT